MIQLGGVFNPSSPRKTVPLPEGLTSPVVQPRWAGSLEDPAVAWLVHLNEEKDVYREGGGSWRGSLS